LVFSLEPRCQGLLGSQKYTCTPLSMVNWAWRAISTPWSQVSDRRNWTGNDWMWRAIAAVTVSES
jgi:hypothetical protein